MRGSSAPKSVQVLLVAVLVMALMALAPLSAQAAAPAAASCSASGLVTLGRVVAPSCKTASVSCSTAVCFLSGSVVAAAKVRVGKVGGNLIAIFTPGGTQEIASCSANAASCSGSGGGVAVSGGTSFQGACGWTGGLLGVLANVSCTLIVTPCFGRPECPWQSGDMITYPQFERGDPVSAAGQLPQAQFGNMYPLGSLRAGSGFVMSFGSATAVQNYLPQFGTPGPLTVSLVDPTSSSSGQFGGEVVGLQLNVDFSDAGLALGASGIPFGNLTICGLTASQSALNGMSVRAFLATSNVALGGGGAPISLSELNAVAGNLTFAFDDGNPNVYAQDHLFNGPCP